jgi:ABC-type phosphate transport system substrate-binding protein
VSARRTRPAAAALAAVVAAAVLAACGVDNKEAGRSATLTTDAAAASASQSAATKTLERQRAAAIARRRDALPKPTPGVVAVEGRAPLGVSPKVQAAFERQSTTAVRFSQTPDAAAFRDLCDGKSDIVESTRSMSASELDRCRENGVDLLTDSAGRVRPLQLASEGIVIATRNASDVGGDCMRRETVRRIFGSGSPIANWSQVGFEDLPLTTAGRPADTNVFNLFGDLVLGANGDADLSDLRADYRVRDSDRSELDEVTGSVRRQRLVAAAAKERDRRVKASRGARRRASAAAAAKADRAFLAVIRRENAARKRKGTVLTPAQAQALEDRNRKRDTAVKRAAAERVSQLAVARIEREVQDRLRRQLAAIDTGATVGFFRYTYYELYEEALRPLEIWDPVAAQASLESRGVATTRSQAEPRTATGARLVPERPNEVSSSERVTYPRTPTKPGATYTTASGSKVTVPVDGPVDVDKHPSCVFPSRTTISSGVYPLSTRLLAYVSKARLKRDEVKAYLAYYLDKGQQVVSTERLIPLGAHLRGEQYKLVTGRALETDTQTAAGPGGTTSTGATTPVTPDATTTPATPLVTGGEAGSGNSGVPGVDQGSGG